MQRHCSPAHSSADNSRRHSDQTDTAAKVSSSSTDDNMQQLSPERSRFNALRSTARSLFLSPRQRSSSRKMSQPNPSVSAGAVGAVGVGGVDGVGVAETTRMSRSPGGGGVAVISIGAPGTLELGGRADGLEEASAIWVPTAYERDLLRKSWSDDFDSLFALGNEIYTYIFETMPDAKKLFTKVARHGDNWKNSSDFKSQSLRFVQVLSHAVKNVHSICRLDDLLVSVGARHVAYVERGFRAEHWAIFQQAIAQSMLKRIQAANSLIVDEKERQDVMELWKFLADYLVSKMQKGFNEAIRQQQRQQQALTATALTPNGNVDH